MLAHQPPLIQQYWSRRPVRWTCYTMAFYFIIFFGVFERVQFIYFQF